MIKRKTSLCNMRRRREVISVADIIAVCRFCEAGSKTFARYVSYIDRKDATRQSEVNKFNIFSHYMDYMDDDMKTVADQSRQTEKVSALFTRDMDTLSTVAKKGIRKAFQSAQENGSNMWQTVISFENSYLQRQGLYDPETGVLNEAQLRQAARKAIGRMLQKEKLENAVWTAAFHYNTDNIHIHIAIAEPEPMREKKTYTIYARDEDGTYLRDTDGHKVPLRDASGKIHERKAYKGVFKRSSIEALKSTLRSEIEHNRQAYQSITRILREDLIGDLKNKTLLNIPGFENQMMDLHKTLVSSSVHRRYWSYNQHRLADLKPQIDALSDLYIRTFHADDFQKLLAAIGTEAQRQTETYGGSSNQYMENLLHGKEGLYARLGNVILQQIAAYDKELKEQIAETKRAAAFLDPGNESHAPDDAIRMLRHLAEHGNSFAHNELGLIYLRGEHVKRDVHMAEHHFHESARHGNEFGEQMLRKIRAGKAHLLYKPQNNYNVQCRWQLRKGLGMLERNLKQTYLQYRNLQEAEQLQAEISSRGEREREA